MVAYVSSSMSVHQRKGGGASCWGKKPRKQRVFTEFCFCVVTADTAELTHKLMREEGTKIPFQPLKDWNSHSSHPNPMMNCAGNHFQLVLSQQDKVLGKIKPPSHPNNEFERVFKNCKMTWPHRDILVFSNASFLTCSQNKHVSITTFNIRGRNAFELEFKVH